MTPDQYWYDNPQLIYNYEQKFIGDIKRSNIEMWAMGGVMRSALSSTVVPIGLAKKASDIPKYMDCPYKDEEVEDYEYSEAEKQALRLKQYASLKALSNRQK